MPRRAAYAMPPNNPSYTPGPYRFIDREYMIISYRTDGDALQRFVPKPDGFDRQAASAFDHPRTEVRLTLRRREMDSNFQYAGAVNLVVGPFGWVVLCDRVRVRARRFWDSAVSATQLGDVSRRRRGGPPHRSIDQGNVFRVGRRDGPRSTGSAAIRPFACRRPRAGCLRR